LAACQLGPLLRKIPPSHIHTYTFTHIHTFTHTYTFTHAHTHIYTHIHTHTYTHSHTHTHTRVHTHAYTYTLITRSQSSHLGQKSSAFLTSAETFLGASRGSGKWCGCHKVTHPCQKHQVQSHTSQRNLFLTHIFHLVIFSVCSLSKGQ
jgi:hypothetical protein